MSKQRFVLLAFVAAALAVGFTLAAALESGMGQFGLPDNRVLGLLDTSSTIAVLGAALTFGVLLRSKRALEFTGEVVGELLRVTWPSRDEAVKASTTVVLTTVFTATTLALYDLTWKTLANYVLYTDR